LGIIGSIGLPFNKLNRISQSICRIKEDRGMGRKSHGTGVYISIGYKVKGILTCNHCIKDCKDFENITISFDDDVSTVLKKNAKCISRSEDPELDYIFFTVDEIEAEPKPVHITPQKIYEGSTVMLFHYHEDNLKIVAGKVLLDQLYMDNTDDDEKELREDKFAYTLDTYEGSSGGPIFSDGDIVGIHTQASDCVSKVYNIGTKIKNIYDHIEDVLDQDQKDM